MGHILNHDERREFQNRQTEHMHAPFYVIDALKLDEDDETNCNNMISLIGNYISCSIPNEKAHPDNRGLYLSDKRGTNTSSHYFL